LAEFGPTGADITPHLRELGIPLVVHFHGHDAHRHSLVNEYRARYVEMFAYANAIISVSQKMTEALIYLGAPAHKIVLNPYGPREKFLQVQSDYRPTVLSVGRFTDIKANYLTIAAFAAASENLPDARLVMIGSGELLEACKTLARIWRVDSRIDFLDAVEHDHVQPFFAKARCFAQHSVSPSYGDSEGSPVAILEAQSAGLPIVATRHAGIMDTVRENETGFLVDELDVPGMAHHLRRLLLDEALARRMGEAAREHIVKHFSLSRHISLLQATLDDATRHLRKE
jgi:glycosyltransferase involved in cell wall biosynthesis